MTRKVKTYKNRIDRQLLDENLLKQAEQIIHSIVSDSEVILYGSQTRGDAILVSDWDFLILVDQPLDRDQIAEVKNALYDLELKTDTILCSIIWISQVNDFIETVSRLAHER